MKNNLALIGICSDENSSFLRGTAAAPSLIREALFSDASNTTSESGVDFRNNPRIQDAGDRLITSGEAGYLGIEDHIKEVLKTGAKPLVLGGDHAISYPVLRAIHQHHGPVNLLHFDAHTDLYDELDGNRYSHACPFARMMEGGLVKRLVQVGIRTLTAHQQEQAARFGVEIHQMQSLVHTPFHPNFDGPLYISFDIDVFDPAFVPGISHYEPGGMSVRDALNIIQQITNPIVGADIVEYNPRRDIHNMTAFVCAKLVKEIGSRMLLNG